MNAHAKPASTSSLDKAGVWHPFTAHSPTATTIVEIRRRRDDKTILRRRSDLPPSFDWTAAEWRAL